MATSKLLESPYSHIKGNSVLKACWADMRYVRWAMGRTLLLFTSLQNAWGHTPLMEASMTDQADIAELLLEHKANVNYRNKKVSSTLHT